MKNTSPLDSIRQKYGNQKFTISFDCADSGITNVEYSAYYVPELKAPKRLGFIFKGWYFDKNFEEPFSKDALYLKMKHITLYPKWEKEELNQPGIYAINYKANLIDSSIILGRDADKVTPWKNVCDFFLKDEIVIEKNYQDKLLLKISYSQDVIVPFPNNGDCFLITPNIKMGNNVKYHSEIAPLSEKKRAVYFDITNYDLEQDIIFNIRFFNYFHPGIEKGLLISSQVNYQISFKVENILGIDRPFINTTKELSDGKYQIKGYFYKGDSKDQLSMLNGWNPIYMNLEVVNNEYFLFLKMIPYEGIIPNYQTNSFLENSKHRMMTYYYAPFYYTYNKEENNNITNLVTHLGSHINGDELRGSQIEYDTSNKFITHKFYLGKTINKDLMLQGVLSGFMEATSAMGLSEVSLRLDRNSVLKVGAFVTSSISSKTATVFSEKVAIYPGATVDLNNGNLLYNYINDYNKLNNRIANFFYETNTNNTDKLLSHRVTFKPNVGKKLKDAKYFIYDAIATYEIFDTNNQSELNIDYTSFHIPNGTAHRTSNRLILGKSFNDGELVNLQQIFYDLICPTTNYELVTKQVYDHNSLINITQTFPFSTNLKVIYTFVKNNISCQATVFLERLSSPNITIVDENNNLFDETKEYLLGDKVFIPKISYEWMGRKNEYYGTNKYNFTGENYDQINYMNILFFYKNNHSFSNFYVTIFSNYFFMDEQNVIKFQIINKFNEVKIYELVISAKKPIRYRIFDEASNLVDQNTIRYHNGKINKVNYDDTKMYPTYNVTHFYKEYYLFEDDEKKVVPLSSYKIYFKNKNTISYNIQESDDFNDIINNLITYQTDGDVVLIKLFYQKDYLTITAGLLFHYTLSGHNTNNIYRYDRFFTNVYYLRQSPQITINGMSCSDPSKAFLISADDTSAGYYEVVNKQGVEYFKINKPGKYKFIYKLYTSVDPYGQFITSDRVSHYFQFVYYAFFEDLNEAKITINYHSDLHKFKDNSNLLTKEYFIKDLINVPGYTSFTNVGDDHFAGWALNPLFTTAQAQMLINGGDALQDIPHRFAKSVITFYAVWDVPIMIRFKINSAIASDTFTDAKLYCPNGSYSLDLSKFRPKNFDSTKYRFLGWRGQITGNEIIKDKQITFIKPTDFELVAVFEVI